jgi:hypothetical protein
MSNHEDSPKAKFDREAWEVIATTIDDLAREHSGRAFAIDAVQRYVQRRRAVFRDRRDTHPDMSLADFTSVARAAGFSPAVYPKQQVRTAGPTHELSANSARKLVLTVRRGHLDELRSASLYGMVELPADASERVATQQFLDKVTTGGGSHGMVDESTGFFITNAAIGLRLKLELLDESSVRTVDWPSVDSFPLLATAYGGILPSWVEDFTGKI